MNLAIGVHHPGHRLGVGAQVRRRDVAVDPQQVLYVGRIAPSQPVQLALAQLMGIALHSSLGASKGDVHERCLPRHERRQRLDLLLVGHGVIANAAFVRASDAIVLYSIPREDLDAPVVHAHRHGHLELSPGSPIIQGVKRRLDPNRLYPPAWSGTARTLRRASARDILLMII